MSLRRRAIALAVATLAVVSADATATTALASTPSRAPVITSLSRHLGSTSGGALLAIRGRDLTHVTLVTIGRADAIRIHHVSPTRIDVRIPQGRPGLYNVRAWSDGVGSTTGVRTHFTYVAPPSITGASRHAGVVEGGQRMLVRGHDFRDVEDVRFGAKSGTAVHVVSRSQLWVTTPAHAAGDVEIVVRSAYGLSYTNDKSANFEFGSRPSVAGLSTTYGSTAGGNYVAISGPHVTQATQVMFNGVRARGLVQYGQYQVQVVAPPHAAGPVHVQVSNAYGTSRATTADLYRYASPDRQHWTASRLIDPVRGFPLALSCAAHLCAFADPEGGLFTKPDTGAAWVVGAAPKDNGIEWRSITCVSDDFCVASGMHSAVTEYDGHRWSTPTFLPDTGYFVALSCASPTDCHAISTTGADLVWNGSSWTAVTDRGAPMALGLRCTTSDDCDAFDSDGNSYHYAGTKWSRTSTSGPKWLVAAACGSATCVALTAAQGTYVLGSTWTAAGASPVATRSLTCATDGSCSGVDSHGMVSTFADGAWSAPVSIGSAATQRYLGCRSKTSCEAIDDDGYVVSLDNGVAAAPVAVDPSQGNITQIACALTVCALLDRYGTAMTRSATGVWSQPTKLARTGGAVACAGSNWCVALAGSDTFVFDGSTWTGVGAVSTALPYSVSCPAVNDCVGVAGTSILHFDGSSWTTDTAVGHPLADVACSSPGHCLAVGETAGQYRLSGTRWVPLGGAPRLAANDSQVSVACPSDQVCFVGNYSGAVVELRGSTWTTTSHVADYAQTLTCMSSTNCLTVGPHGASTFDGKTWTLPEPIAQPPFQDTASRIATDVAVSSGKWLVTSVGYVIESA